MRLKKKNDPCNKRKQRCKKRNESPSYNGRNSGEFLCAVEDGCWRVFVGMIQCKEIIMNETHGALTSENGRNDRRFNITSRTVSRMRTFWFLVDEYCGNAR
jgi:hypothetical protein